MSLLDTTRSAVGTAFNVLDSFKIEIILVFGQGTYDPNTDTTGTGTATSAIRGFFYSESEAQSGDSVGESGTVLLQQTDVTAAGLPLPVDEATKAIFNSKTWEVSGVSPDPANATVKLFVRRG